MYEGRDSHIACESHLTCIELERDCEDVSERNPVRTDACQPADEVIELPHEHGSSQYEDISQPSCALEVTTATLKETDHASNLTHSSVRPPRGLRNLGNTCFMNAVLQCLMSITDLVTALDNLDHMSSEQMPIVTAYRKLLHTSRNTSKEAIDVRELKQILGQHVNPKYLGFNQHDSLEFLLYMLSTMDDELSLAFDAPSCVKEMLYLHRINMYVCKTCGHTCNSPESISVVSVEIPLEERALTLHDCLTYTFAPREHEFALCSCGATTCQQTSKLSNPRDNLIIGLRRFSLNAYGTMKKVNVNVDFPLVDLEVNEFCDSPVEEKYELLAVTNHYGTLAGGHYTAYCKHGEDWYLCDDSTVVPVEADSVSSRNACLLFYRRSGL